MFTPINGYTRETMMARIRERNNDTRCVERETDMCVYELVLPDGTTNHCGAGCFMPAGHPVLAKSQDAEVRNLAIGGVLATYPDLTESMPLNEAGMVALQMVHDAGDDSGVHERMESWINYHVGP